MATRAQQFRAQEQRKRHEAPKPKRNPHLADPKHTNTRNAAKRIEKNAQAKLEDSMSGRPSRKSTRASMHHGRPDELIQRTAQSKSMTPKARALRSQLARR